MSNKNSHINPDYRKFASKRYSLEEAIEGITTNRYILSWLISKAESTDTADLEYIQKILSSVEQGNNTRRIAISGSPGVGKSSFLNSYGKYLIDKGNKVAILPVDPTSYNSLGSILGDKTRMEDLIGEEKVYIKPMASSLVHGGIAPATRTAIKLCERAGYDTIFVETVGVGQAEYEARHMVDMFLLLLQPGAGDDLQGIKRGIMEMADMLIVTKADSDLEKVSSMSVKNYQQAINITKQHNEDWTPPVVKYSSLTHMYRKDVENVVESYFDFLSINGRLTQLRQQQEVKYFDEAIDDIILASFKRREEISNLLQQMKEKISRESLTPLHAIQLFRDKIKENND